MVYKYIDIHCHSTLKPYSKSFKVQGEEGSNSLDIAEEKSIWHAKLPTLFNKIGNLILSVTKFTQADFTTSLQRGVQVMMVSIDPMERNLVLSKKGNPQTFVGQLIKNFIIGIGMPRIKFLTHKLNDDYFSDLERTRDYLVQLNGSLVPALGGDATYELVKDFPLGPLKDNRLYIIFTIEGGHVFNTTLPNVLDRVTALKQWEPRPLWVSLSHHFPNGLCGHAKSFLGLSRIAYDQKSDPNQGIEPLGEAVIKKLLDDMGGKKRILVDVKHMNLKSRMRYYTMADQLKVPIVVSHGALMFKKAPSQMNTEINFYDEEIIKIAESRGLFGIQLDQRRIKQVKKLKGGASKPPKLKINRAFRRAWRAKTRERFKKRLYRRAYYIWKQVSYMAELLDEQGLRNGEVWDFQAIGSDFDGIVDPLDGFWTHAEFDRLAYYLQLNIEMYVEKDGWSSLRPENRLEVHRIMKNLCSENVKRFLENAIK